MNKFATAISVLLSRLRELVVGRPSLVVRKTACEHRATRDLRRILEHTEEHKESADSPMPTEVEQRLIL